MYLQSNNIVLFSQSIKNGINQQIFYETFPFLSQTFVNGLSLSRQCNRFKQILMIICCLIPFHSKSQVTITAASLSPDPAVTSNCIDDYPVLNADICPVNAPDVLLIAFINDKGSSGEELTLTVIDRGYNITDQFSIKPPDVKAALNAQGFTNDIELLSNPDITLVHDPLNTTSVSAMRVFDTYDQTYNLGSILMEVVITLPNPSTFTFTTYDFTLNPTLLCRPVSFDAFSASFSKSPRIDGDPTFNRFGIVSLQEIGTSGLFRTYTSYYEYNSTYYDFSSGYENIPSSIVVSNQNQVMPDIAVSNEINSGDMESVVSYIDEEPTVSFPVINVYTMPAGSTTPFITFTDNFYISSKTAVNSQLNYPRICGETEFDNLGTTFNMRWSLTASNRDQSMTSSIPVHLMNVHSDLNYVTYLDNPSPSTYGKSYHWLPALDWMVDAGDAFVAVHSYVDNPSYFNDVYGIMNPVYPLGMTTYVDWYQINTASAGSKNMVAVASNPIFDGYIVAWYGANKIYYKINSTSSTSY